MTHPTRAGIGLVRMGESGFAPENPADDLRGKSVYDQEGQRMGSVQDLYVDRREREVRFLEVGSGDFLGMGEKRFFLPIEAVTRVAEDQVTVEPSRTEWVAGPAPFGTNVADSRKHEYSRTRVVRW